MLEESLFSFETEPEPPWQPPTLETARLILRPVTDDDLVPLFEICSNPNMTQYTLWETHQSHDNTNFFIRNYARSRMGEQVPDPLIAVLKETNEVVGTLGCFWGDATHKIMELGYNIGEPWWGKGLAVEASKALIDHVFANFLIERLQTRIFSQNIASIRVADKLGMTFEGILRHAVFKRYQHWDLQIFSLLRKEWKS